MCVISSNSRGLELAIWEILCSHVPPGQPPYQINSIEIKTSRCGEQALGGVGFIFYICVAGQLKPAHLHGDAFLLAWPKPTQNSHSLDAVASYLPSSIPPWLHHHPIYYFCSSICALSNLLEQVLSQPFSGRAC